MVPHLLSIWCYKQKYIDYIIIYKNATHFPWGQKNVGLFAKRYPLIPKRDIMKYIGSFSAIPDHSGPFEEAMGHDLPHMAQKTKVFFQKCPHRSQKMIMQLLRPVDFSKHQLY